MACKDCPNWQGNKLSKWADCHHVIGKIAPQLFKYKGILRDPYTHTERYINFNVPFDPNDIKKFKDLQRSEFTKEYYEALKGLPKGVRKDRKYLQTHKDFDCNDL